MDRLGNLRYGFNRQFNRYLHCDYLEWMLEAQREATIMTDAKIRTHVTFENPSFNTTEHKEYFINEGCYGDDLANALMEQLRLRGYQTDTEPGPEDFGWYFGFRAGDMDYQFVIGHRPGDETDPPVWIGWVERKVGFIGSIFGACNRGIQPAGVNAMDSAISALAQVRNIKWHQKEDFDAGKEELGQPKPIERG